MKRNIIRSTLDCYFDNPILYDSILMIAFIVSSYYMSPILTRVNIPLVKILEKPNEVTYISSLASISVMLAGFIVAALTILVTVKASLKARGFEDSENALEYIFSTKHYKSIIQVFKGSIIELVFIFIILFGTWLLSDGIHEKNIYRILAISTFGIVASTFRSLFILFQVLDLENFKKQ